MAKVFFNDSIVDDGQAKIAADDSAFLYGMGLFETMRAVGGEVFRVDDHLDRLFASCAALDVKNTYEKDYIKKAVGQVLIANELADARVRLTLSSGSVSDDDGPATLLISATPLAAYPDEFYEKGIAVTLCNWRQNSYDPLCGHKTTNYFAKLIGLKEAHKKKAVESLWFTTDNKLAEGCVSNVFLVKDGTVSTPPLDTPVLPGIARKTVIEITLKEDIMLQEKELSVNDLLEADEIFVTNTIMTVMPVVSVEAHTVGDGKPGEVTKKLLECYRGMLID